VRSLIEGLPAEIAKRVHPDWKKNETEYWVQRDTLLRHYANGLALPKGASSHAA